MFSEQYLMAKYQKGKTDNYTNVNYNMNKEGIWLIFAKFIIINTEFNLIFSLANEIGVDPDKTFKFLNTWIVYLNSTGTNKINNSKYLYLH